MPTGPLDHDDAFAGCVVSSDPTHHDQNARPGHGTEPDHGASREQSTPPGHSTAVVHSAGFAQDVGTEAWQVLLDTVAAGHLRLTLTLPSGQRAVLVAEEELVTLQAAASAAKVPQVALTPRERQVLQRLAAGDSPTEAAAQLGMSTSTVSQHLASARRKYGVHTTGHAVAMAREASHLT